MSLNNRLECNILIKADDISTGEANKIRTKNKIMNEHEGNFKSSKNGKKINKNFLRKQIIKENNNFKNDQEEEECLLDDFSKNHVFQYYYSTIEYMKKYYYNYYINSDYKIISKNNNTLNVNNDFSYDKNIYESYLKSSNINNNNQMNNNFLVNNCQDKQINFIDNNCKNENDKNKTSGSYNNLENEDTKKINEFSKEVIFHLYFYFYY
jgi:hypothetical protein